MKAQFIATYYHFNYIDTFTGQIAIIIITLVTNIITIVNLKFDVSINFFDSIAAVIPMFVIKILGFVNYESIEFLKLALVGDKTDFYA